MSRFIYVQLRFERLILIEIVSVEISLENNQNYFNSSKRIDTIVEINVGKNLKFHHFSSPSPLYSMLGSI